jgi:serine/threonine protein kinase
MAVPSPGEEGQGEGGPTFHSQPSTLDPLSYVPHTLRYDLERHSRLPIPDCVQIGLSLATALAHLHEQGLVHRDIKPSNIIFVNGVAKLGDIGLVTEAGDTQSIVGTEGYLPPEGPGTPQADLFSLGKVLYEMSTGMDRRRFAELPDDLRDWPDRNAVFEFNEIVLKTCAAEPRLRYRRTEDLRADLVALAGGHSLTRRRRLKGWMRVGAIAVMAVGMLALGIMLVQGWQRSRVNPSNRLPDNPLAVKEFEEGVHCIGRDTPQGVRLGREHLKRAIDLDSKFAMAYAWLYETYIDGPEARDCVARMLELEPNLAEAHAALGFMGFRNRDWLASEKHFLRAIELNPRSAIAHDRYGFCLVHAGRPDEAFRELSLGEQLSPRYPRFKKNLGHYYYVKRRFPEAIAHYKDAMNLEPGYAAGHYFLANAYRAQGDFTNAIAEFEAGHLAFARNPAGVRSQYDALRAAFAANGARGYWLKQLEQASDLDIEDIDDVGGYWPAQSWAQLRDFDMALIYLEGYFAEDRNARNVPVLLYDECWDPVHEDPRFIAILRSMKLKK